MRYKLSIVSYLNTIPFIYGLKQSGLDKRLDINLDFPSVCANKLISGKVDVGLVPIVVLKQLKDPYIISDFCIGADGAVDTVCLFSNVPIHEIESIFLDYQSQTSVTLLRILLEEYWNISPDLQLSERGYEDKIKERKAGLIIGDRAFKYKSKFAFAYDLAAIWNLHTGLPFVFACWIANKEIDQNFQNEFNTALSFGVNNIDKAIDSEGDIYSHYKHSTDYLNNKISYQLDAEKRKAMRIFLKKI
ncbi:MAG: menaquinone biosynthesis protein [Bacteroidota bacterium]|nr:menaquinone biosynthesis protein [Bacteroidota bacterium]